MSFATGPFDRSVRVIQLPRSRPCEIPDDIRPPAPLRAGNTATPAERSCAGRCDVAACTRPERNPGGRCRSRVLHGLRGHDDDNLWGADHVHHAADHAHHVHHVHHAADIVCHSTRRRPTIVHHRGGYRRDRLVVRVPGGDELGEHSRAGALQHQCELHAEQLGPGALRVHQWDGRLRGQRHGIREFERRHDPAVLSLRIHPDHRGRRGVHVQHSGPHLDPPADQLHRVPAPDWTDHELERPSAEAKWGKCECDLAQSSRRAGHGERSGRYQLRARGVLHRRAARRMGPVRQERGRLPAPQRRAHQCNDSRVELGGTGQWIRRVVDIGGGLQRRQQPRWHRSRAGELRHRLGVHGVQPGQGSCRDAERERQVHLADSGRTLPRPWPTPRSRPTAHTNSTSTGWARMSTTRRPTATC